MKLSKLLKIFSFPIFVYLLNEVVVDPYIKYTSYPWIDIPMHFIGGVAMAISAALLLDYWRTSKMYRAHWLIDCAFVLCFVAFAAVVWEWYEYLLKFFFDVQAQPSVADTMGDFFFGLLGALFVCPFMKRKSK